MLHLECKGHDTSFELGNILHLFEPYTQDTLRIESVLEGNKAKTLLYDGDKLIATNEALLHFVGDAIQDKREKKVKLKKLVYQILANYTEQMMPWGILTGIRPTKIVHECRLKGMSEEAIATLLEEDYCIAKDKVRLMVDVATAETKVLVANQHDEISIYIGIPFCPTRCVYCSFTAYSIEAKKQHVAAYLDALCKEISYIAEAKRGCRIRSLYIGGGTPTSLDEAQFERLLSHISTCFDTAQIGEYTVEAGRPDTITRAKLEVMKQNGVGRISINPQTMNQKTLDVIGRRHSVAAIKEVFAIAREVGHTNINMDMILGLPGEEVSDVAYTLDELAKLAPENITIHTMAIKRASRLKQEQQQYKLTEVDKIQQMLALCKERTEAMGLKPYYMYRQKDMLGNFENVGYTKPGYECIYNIEIMEEKQTIIAAGAGATTKVVHQKGERIERVPNVKGLEEYIARIDEMIERKRQALMQYTD